MPVYRYTPPSKSDKYQDLLGRLVSEIKAAPAAARAKSEAAEFELHEGAAPLVFEDPDPRGGRFGVTVLWEDWEDIGLQERGGMILDAYREAKGEEEMLKISRALGLTETEAERLGLHF